MRYSRHVVDVETFKGQVSEQVYISSSNRNKELLRVIIRVHVYEGQLEFVFKVDEKDVGVYSSIQEAVEVYNDY